MSRLISAAPPARAVESRLNFAARIDKGNQQPGRMIRMMKQSAGVASFFLNSSIFISPVMAGEKIDPKFCARQEATLERVCAINSGPGIRARYILDVRLGALTAAQRHSFTS